MQIAENHVVSMDYVLKDDDGNVLDTSEGREPLSFLYGKGMIIPGLEKALEGKEKGDSVQVTVQPEEGYGTYNEEAIGEVNKDNFQEDMEPKVGMQVQAQDPNGNTQIFTITDVKDETVTLDGNHPLAGQVLHFDVNVTDVREATEEELEHGHVH
ncbi:MAG: FKBP-type peptidyl-prolyl cis-trans isomerase [Spirochaetota bacterium]